MRDKYRGYFRPIDASVEKTWSQSIFVFDANILLNLYRYSDETRSQFLRVAKGLEKQLWLPYRAGLEYLERRVNVIEAEAKTYDEARINIEKLEKSFEQPRQHPFISPKLSTKISKLFDEIKSDLDRTKETYLSRVSKDDIQDEIVKIFEARVGDPMSEETVTEICTKGEERYKEKVPPGYMDFKKDENDNTKKGVQRKFGDLIIWEEIINYAKEHEKDVVFVTDDRKEDWWRRSSGKTIGPRPELIEEFFHRAGRRFEMYEAHQFLSISSRLSNIEVPDAVEEIRLVSKQRRIEKNRGSSQVIGLGLLDNLIFNPIDLTLEESKEIFQRLDILGQELDWVDPGRMDPSEWSALSATVKDALKESDRLQSFWRNLDFNGGALNREDSEKIEELKILSGRILHAQSKLKSMYFEKDAYWRARVRDARFHNHP